MTDKINVINDQHVFSGTFTHALKIHQNLLTHGYKSEFLQFLLSGNSSRLPENAIIRKGFLYGFDSNSKRSYQVKLAVNFLTGRNWRSFKNLDNGRYILSGPSLLNLSKYLKNSITIGHDLYFLERSGNPILRTYMRKMYKLYKLQDLIMADSNFTRREFINKLGIEENGIITVYPAFDNEFFKPGVSNIRDNFNLDDEDRILLSIGGDNPNKNIETVLRLMKILPDNFKLIRVGSSYNTTRIINNLSLSSRIIQLSNINMDYLADIYRGSDLLIFPSIFEGFGIPLVEAMACGTPVITSDRTCLPEVVGEAGLVYDPHDVTGMKEAVMRITNDDGFRKELVEKGIERSTLFSRESQFKSLYKAIKMLD